MCTAYPCIYLFIYLSGYQLSLIPRGGLLWYHWRTKKITRSYRLPEPTKALTTTTTTTTTTTGIRTRQKWSLTLPLVQWESNTSCHESRRRSQKSCFPPGLGRYVSSKRWRYVSYRCPFGRSKWWWPALGEEGIAPANETNRYWGFPYFEERLEEGWNIGTSCFPLTLSKLFLKMLMLLGTCVEYLAPPDIKQS